jgi:serine/threonine protein kinase
MWLFWPHTCPGPHSDNPVSQNLSGPGGGITYGLSVIHYLVGPRSSRLSRLAPMPLSTCTKLGTYEITSHIGSGGMGEVYQAHDSKLGRDVDIKVLPEQFARDPERLASSGHPTVVRSDSLRIADSSGSTLRANRSRPWPMPRAGGVGRGVATARFYAPTATRAIYRIAATCGTPTELTKLEKPAQSDHRAL